MSFDEDLDAFEHMIESQNEAHFYALYGADDSHLNDNYGDDADDWPEPDFPDDEPEDFTDYICEFCGLTTCTPECLWTQKLDMAARSLENDIKWVRNGGNPVTWTIADDEKEWDIPF